MKKNFKYRNKSETAVAKTREQTSAIFELIFKETQNKSALNVLELCKLAGVSRSGYYRWIAASNQRAIREASDYQDFLLIKEAYDYRGYAKGSRGICMRLKRMGITMNRKKSAKINAKIQLVLPYTQSQSISKNGKGITYKYNCPELR